MLVPPSSRSKPPAEPATPSASSSNPDGASSGPRGYCRAAAWCAPLLACALYARSFWGSPAFGELADQGYHLELGRAFSQGWQAGEFPPAWSATANGGRGSPAFQLYPPLFSFLAASWMRALGPTPEALRWAAFTAVLFNLGAIYWAARSRLAPHRAALAAGLTLLLPGVTFVALGRGMFPNFLAVGWVALAAGAAQRAVDRGRFHWLALAAAGAGLILTHTPTAYLAALLAATLLLVRRSRRCVFGAAVAAGIALAATAWFWAPMLRVAAQAQTGYLSQAHPYAASLWFRSGAAAGPFAQDWAFLTQIGAAIGAAQIALAAVLLPRRYSVATLTPVAVWSLAASVWPSGEWLMALPYYANVQFCWRWQPLLALACALAFAGLTKRHAMWAAAPVSLVVLVFLPLAAPSNQPRGAKPDLASNLIEMRPLGAAHELFLPGPPGLTDVLDGSCTVEPIAILPSLRTYRIHAATPCRLRLRTYYFPGWTATLDGRPIAIQPEPGTALQLVELSAGATLLTLRYDASMILVD